MSNEYQTILAVVGGLVILLLFLYKREKKEIISQKEDPATLNAKFREACQLSEDATIIIDRSGKVVFSNLSAKKLFSLSENESLQSLDSRLEFFLPNENRTLTTSELIEYHRVNNRNDSSFFNEVKLGTQDDKTLNLSLKTIRFATTPQRYTVFSFHDRSCEKKLMKMHHLNPLTGLPNQMQAFSDITRMTSSLAKNRRFAVMVIELDNPSYFRSILGYIEIGRIIDTLAHTLREVAEENPRLSIYHLNYVTFLLLVNETNDFDEIYALFQNFQQRFHTRYTQKGEEDNLSFSGGVSFYPREKTLHELLDGAYSALAEAQEAGQGQLVVADESHEATKDKEHRLNEEIKRALENEEIKLYFQPILRAGSYTLFGAEVLIRWHHPERGIISPDLFIPIAERSGLILDIGRYVMKEALRHMSSWNSFGFPPLTLNVNLSLRELEDPDFVTNIANLLSRYDIGDSKIKLEITEHSSMRNPTLTHQRLQELKKLDIAIALDDFGTGYSSFAYLAEFPIETLKIDRGFVSDINQNPDNRHIVTSMIRLGHALGMTIVAEGIETVDDAKTLSNLGADFLQGYLFSKPVSQLEFQYFITHPDALFKR